METKPIKPSRTLADMLEAYKPQIAKALPAHMTADRMIKVALSAIGRSEELRKCTPASVVKAVVLSSELGLEAGGLLGEAYLVPFGRQVVVNGVKEWIKEATLIPGYRGLIKLARQSGEVSTVIAHVVYEADEYEVSLGIDQMMIHRPNLVTKDRGKPLFAYAWVQMKDGSRMLDVMSESEIEAIRMRSQTGRKNSGPWMTDRIEMWRKTVTRRLLKYAPLSADRFNRAMSLDDEMEGEVVDASGELTANVAPLDAARARSEARSKQLAARIGGLTVDEALPADEEPAPTLLTDQKLVDQPPKSGLARDGSDGSVPADQEPPEREPGED